MAETWPASLQQKLNQAQWSETDEDTNIITSPATGPIKSRRRFTQPETTMTCQIVISRSEYQTLKDFTRITLKSRTLEFEFNHPVTGLLVNYRMDKPEVIAVLGGTNFTVNMVWRQMP